MTKMSSFHMNNIKQFVEIISNQYELDAYKVLNELGYNL